MSSKSITVFVVFVALFTLTAGGHLYSPDEEIMFRTTEALATRGALSIEPIGDPASGRTFATRRGVDGGEYAQYGLGNSLFAVPFYYAGWLGARLLGEESAVRLLDFETTSLAYVPPSAARGEALVTRFALSFFGIFVAAATCVVLWRFCLGLARAVGAARPVLAAWLVTLAYGAGTMAWPHSRTFFSEPLATFFVLLAFYLAWRSRTLSLGAVAASGAAFALALLTRLDSVVVLPALGLFGVLRYLELRVGGVEKLLHGEARSMLRLLVSGGFVGRCVVFALPLFAFVLLQLALNWAHFGSPLASGYSDQPEGIHFSTPLLAGLYGFLMSVGKSVFLFSPAIVLGLLGFSAFWRRQTALAAALAAAILLLLLFHARWQNWAGGWGWGPRHLFMAHVFAVLPAVGFVAGAGAFRRLVYAGVLAVAVGVQLYGSSQSFIDFYILYYRTPHTPPLARVMYSGEDMAPQAVPAPIHDSIYVPHNSQWYRYAEMQRWGYTDNLWLRLARRLRGEERALP